jgi:hypothetical protein
MLGSKGPSTRARGGLWLRWLLRFQGTVDLLALVVPLLSVETIGRLHAALGLGEFPQAAIAEYLSRNLPLLVALHGLLLWGVATDLVRYRPLIALLGWSAIAHGAWLVLIDWQAGLPGWWVASEGPLRALLGGAMLVLLRGVPRVDLSRSDRSRSDRSRTDPTQSDPTQSDPTQSSSGDGLRSV